MIFTAVQTGNDAPGYAQTGAEMEQLAAAQPGFLGIEHAGGADGSITVSYWRSLEDIAAWRRHADHATAQRAGRERWYRTYAVRVAKVEREAFFPGREKANTRTGSTQPGTAAALTSAP